MGLSLACTNRLGAASPGADLLLFPLFFRETTEIDGIEYHDWKREKVAMMHDISHFDAALQKLTIIKVGDCARGHKEVRRGSLSVHMNGL